MSWLRDNFHVNRIQRLGLIVLATIMFILMLVRISMNHYLPLSPDYTHVLDTVSFVEIKKDEYKSSSKVFKKKSKNLSPDSYKNSVNSSKEIKKVKSIPKKENERFLFDPNIVSKDELKRLGFKSYVAENWIKFREKGAKFYELGDLKKIYGIDKHLLTSLESYIKYPQKRVPKKNDSLLKLDKVENVNEAPKKSTKRSYNKSSKYTFDKVVNLNQATNEELLEVPGIGKYYAKQILKLRDELGGFYSKEQLLSIYKLSKENYLKFEKYLEVDNNYQKIEINSLDVKKLASHKYISWKVANVIVNYRNNHGQYKKIDDLKKIKIIDDNLLNKVSPYISYHVQGQSH